MTGERTEKEKAAIRGAAMVIAIAMASWMGLSFLGGQLGWPVRFAFLIDMLCLAAFVWALWVIIRVWRAGAGKGN
ncbi:DUF5337 family protein [Rhodovulum sp. DZ06]|uniref:DUF5337 family protein n=1 Tax=Rhodovulum sp. DZ06 TaxID=3425126 RepID=UPI003D3424EC